MHKYIAHLPTYVHSGIGWAALGLIIAHTLYACASLKEDKCYVDTNMYVQKNGVYACMWLYVSKTKYWSLSPSMNTGFVFVEVCTSFAYQLANLLCHLANSWYNKAINKSLLRRVAVCRKTEHRLILSIKIRNNVLIFGC